MFSGWVRNGRIDGGALPGVVLPQGGFLRRSGGEKTDNSLRPCADPFRDGEDDNQEPKYHAPRARLAGESQKS